MYHFWSHTVSRVADVKDGSGSLVKIRVWRTRASDGTHEIGIKFGEQQIKCTSGDSEQHARVLNEMLDEVIDEPCELPSIGSR